MIAPRDLSFLPRFTFRNRNYCREAALDVGFVSRPGCDANAHCSLAVPHCSTAPAGTIFLNRPNNALRGLCISKRHEYLIEHDLIQDAEALGFELFRGHSREPAGAFDQVR